MVSLLAAWKVAKTVFRAVVVTVVAMDFYSADLRVPYLVVMMVSQLGDGVVE